jgi:multiple sugar transport system substrate-binding protein
VGGSNPETGAASGTLQVAWWGGNDRAERTQKVMDQYSARNPQWKFSSSFTNFFAYWDKINTQAAGGALPDVFQMDMRYIGQFVSKKLVLDLTRFADTQLNLGDFDAGLLSQGKLDGGLYAVPLGGIVQATVYDRTAITQAGMAPPSGTTTWADYAAYCEKLSKALPTGTYASDDESPNIDPFEVFIRQRNKELYTADGKANFTRQDLVDWFQYWADIRKAGACVPGEIASAFFQSDTPETTPLVQGKAAFKMRWTNFLTQYQPLTQHELVLMPNPAGGPGTRPGAYLKAGSLFSVSARTNFAQGAAGFIGFFLTDTDAVKVLSLERGVPGSAKARTTVKPDLGPVDAVQLNYFDQQTQNTTPKAVLDPPGAGEFQKALARNALSIPLSGVSVSEAADKLMAEATKALSA